MAAKRRKDGTGFRVAQCSVCEHFKLTVGEQRAGGVRYCEDCLAHTLTWHQMDQTRREKVRARFAALATQPVVQTALEAGKAITPEERKAHAIGESRRRLMEANLRDA
jgi:hypothetical protein